MNNSANAIITPFELELLDKVYASPFDDAPRLVYADWLLEQGLPRGELIMLQYKSATHGLIPRERERERQMLHRYLREWIGPLFDVLDQNDIVFSRGFLSACTAWLPKDPPESLLERPEWSTVERLGGDLEAILHRAARGLRSVGPLTAASLTSLLDRRTVLPSIEELRIEGGLHGASIDRSLWTTPMFPSLKRLAFVYPDHFPVRAELLETLQADRYAPFLSSIVGAKLEAFAVRHPHFSIEHRGELPPIGAALNAWTRVFRGSNLSKLAFVPSRGLGFHLTRAPSGEIALVIEWHSNFASAHPKLITEALSYPELRRLSSVRIDQHGVHLPHHQAMMEQIVASHQNGRFRHRAQSGPRLPDLEAETMPPANSEPDTLPPPRI